jgi:hypothetical protein
MKISFTVLVSSMRPATDLPLVAHRANTHKKYRELLLFRYGLSMNTLIANEGRAQPIANPALVERLRVGAPLNVPDRAPFVGGDSHRYTDFPFMSPSEGTG